MTYRKAGERQSQLLLESDNIIMPRLVSRTVFEPDLIIRAITAKVDTISSSENIKEHQSHIVCKFMHKETLVVQSFNPKGTN